MGLVPFSKTDKSLQPIMSKLESILANLTLIGHFCLAPVTPPFHGTFNLILIEK